MRQCHTLGGGCFKCKPRDVASVHSTARKQSILSPKLSVTSRLRHWSTGSPNRGFNKIQFCLCMQIFGWARSSLLRGLFPRCSQQCLGFSLQWLVLLRSRVSRVSRQGSFTSVSSKYVSQARWTDLADMTGSVGPGTQAPSPWQLCVLKDTGWQTPVWRTRLEVFWLCKSDGPDHGFSTLTV